MNETIVYSALKPTGELQLGNYIGALRNMVKLQEEHKCIYTIADLHSLTVDNVPKDLRGRTYDFMAMFLAIGLDPNKSVLFAQSHVPAHCELAWILNCYTQFGEARRMTQFKEKSDKNSANINLGLFSYPTLMAADILLYQANYVPIGKDQKQHLELAKIIAERFNNKYSPTFTMPEGIFNKVGAKIQNLKDPASKMGKTDDDTSGVIFLLDDPDTITRKFKKAVTDSDNIIRVSPDKLGITNLLTIYSIFNNCTVDQAEEYFANKSYAEFKDTVGECVIEYLKPIQQKHHELVLDKPYLDKIMAEGAEKASRIAFKTLSKVQRKIGLVPRSY